MPRFIAFRDFHVNITPAVDGSHAYYSAISGTCQFGIRLTCLRIDDLERNFLTIRVSEAHLQFSIYGKQLHLIGNIRQE